MSTPFNSTPFAGLCNKYHEEIQDEIKSVEHAILKGVADFTEYRQLVGKRHGLYLALERHKELLSYMERD